MVLSESCVQIIAASTFFLTTHGVWGTRRVKHITCLVGAHFRNRLAAYCYAVFDLQWCHLEQNLLFSLSVYVFSVIHFVVLCSVG